MGIEVEGAKLSKVKLLVKLRFYFYALSDNSFLFLHSFRKISFYGNKVIYHMHNKEI